MRYSARTCIFSVAVFGLAACGGSGGGGNGASGAATALNYDPVFATAGNPTIGVSQGDSGVTGVSILVDGFNDRLTFENVKIRTTNSGATLVLTVNGRDFTLNEQSGSTGIYTDGQVVLTYRPDAEDTFYEFGSSSITAGALGLRNGFVGVETPVAELGGGETLYRGSLVINLDATGNILDIDQIAGTLEITTNFDTGEMSGEYIFGLLDTLGTVSGDTQGNGIIGTLTLQDESGYAGDLQVVGKTFGQDGSTLAGVTGGTGLINNTSGNAYNGSGTFELEEVPF